MSIEDLKNKIEQREQSANAWLSKIREDDNREYDPLVTYYFVNKNLKMSAGKIGVQCARAGQIMLKKELREPDTLLLDSLNELDEHEFMRGNKSICLRANNNQLLRILAGDLKEKLVRLSLENNVPIRTYPVFDIGATEVKANSLTVVALTPVKQSIIRDFVRKFHIY